MSGLTEGMVFNVPFSHTTILFHQRSRDKYIIDNSVIMDDLSIRVFYSYWQMNWMLTRLIIRKIRGKLTKMLGKRA